MVVECPICSKVLNNEEICSYCGTNINEDIFTDFTSFQKLKRYNRKCTKRRVRIAKSI